MTSLPTTAADERVAFRQNVTTLVTQGRFDQALDLCDAKAAEARARSDQDLLDQASVIHTYLHIQCGRGGESVPELRRILLRTTDLVSKFYCAYAISFHHKLEGDPDKAQFYGKQALTFAQQWGDRSSIAGAHNNLANLLVIASFFDEATTEYAEAIELQDPVDSPSRAVLLANIGYCRVVLGRLRRGYSDLITSLRMMRRLDCRVYQPLPMMGLSFASLEIGKPERARQYAEKALELSEQHENPDSIKKCLYLLGEAEKYCGRATAAYESFSMLQRRFYPENPMVVDLLMAADVRRMINLMA